MTKAIETLMNEHRFIEQVLGSLETYIESVEAGKEAPRVALRGYAEFFSNFADKCHHGKEEDQLFALMAKNGFPTEYGPIAVMLSDHAEGRSSVQALAAIASGSGPLSAKERADAAGLARNYIALLRSHILKEDNILYPMALQAIKGEQMDELAAEFEAFEKKVMGEGAHERFHALAEELIAAYPPDPVKMSATSACVGCSGHA